MLFQNVALGRPVRAGHRAIRKPAVCYSITNVDVDGDQDE